jgi:hypothetical protein
MPRGRSTFNKRQKEQARQQRQRDKAERKSLRKQEKQNTPLDETSELIENARAQAALFNFGAEEPVAPASVDPINRREVGN